MHEKRDIILQEDVIQTLKELGLTPLQAKVYLATSILEKPTANEIAKLSKVARQEIYRIINELSELGLVSRVITTPTTFKPLPLSEGTSLLLERKIKKTAELQAKVIELIHNNISKRETTEHRNYEFAIIPEKAPWFEKNIEMFENYQTFDLLTTFRRFSSRMFYDEEIYRKAIRRGARIRILMEKPPNGSPILPNLNALKEHKNFEVKYFRTASPIVLFIMDQKSAALATLPSNDAGPPYLVSNHPSFVYLAMQYFEKMWEICCSD